MSKVKSESQMSKGKQSGAKKALSFSTWEARRAGHPPEIKKWFLSFTIFLIFYGLLLTFPVFAGPQSSTYELKEFGFGSGGTENIDSTTYSLFGTVGEMDVASAESNTFRTGAGLIFTMQAFTPPKPTVSNSNQNYDRLLVTVQTGGNPTDTKYAISITDGTTTQYIQNDYTVGSVLGSEDWLLYTGGQTVGWGGASGFYVTGLLQDTPYSFRVKAKQGSYTETGWSVDTYETTMTPTLTFGIDSPTISFSALNAGNSYTDSSKLTTVTVSTNAYNGYIIYGHSSQPLTHTGNGSLTIADYTNGTNATPTTWTGTGFGYTTNDSNLTGGTADRFTNGGPKYAGFINSPPGEPIADRSGPILLPVNDQFNLSYRVTAQSTTAAGEYKTTVIYVVVPTY